MVPVDAFLYLTTNGRVTGKPGTIEIWFVEHEGRFYVVSEMREQSGWVKNLERDPRVRFRVGTRADTAQGSRDASARVVHEADTVAAVRALMDAKYGWSDGLVVEIAPSG
jgi:deazaflavin-dependent oxidoreductase (nitroreductase family)